jgi:hypothetical protein
MMMMMWVNMVLVYMINDNGRCCSLGTADNDEAAAEVEVAFDVAFVIVVGGDRLLDEGDVGECIIVNADADRLANGTGHLTDRVLHPSMRCLFMNSVRLALLLLLLLPFVALLVGVTVELRSGNDMDDVTDDNVIAVSLIMFIDSQRLNSCVSFVP